MFDTHAPHMMIKFRAFAKLSAVHQASLTMRSRHCSTVVTCRCRQGLRPGNLSVLQKSREYAIFADVSGDWRGMLRAWSFGWLHMQVLTLLQQLPQLRSLHLPGTHVTHLFLEEVAKTHPSVDIHPSDAFHSTSTPSFSNPLSTAAA